MKTRTDRFEVYGVSTDSHFLVMIYKNLGSAMKCADKELVNYNWPCIVVDSTRSNPDGSTGMIVYATKGAGVELNSKFVFKK